jgi:hypothetical protein
MNNLLSHPFGVFAIAVVALSLAALIGDFFGRRARRARAADQGEFTTILAATLTLLSLIIGFSFAMAISRYDERKNYEEGEANAIGTAYVRADLLPAENAAVVRDLLKKYLEQRVLFYQVADPVELSHINAETAKLQGELWSSVVHAAEARPTPTIALVVSGINDVLNSQGYTQAAWWNVIPHEAWELMGFVAFFANLLSGYAERRTYSFVLFVLPVMASFSFALIADIDSPRGGVVRILPQNLLALSQSMKQPQ